MKILVTGAAGFIGMHVARQLLERGDEVYGIDNLNDYYDPRLKHARLAELTHFPNFRFEHVDVADKVRLDEVFASFRPEKVVHLAAQAGVRYSLKHPDSYVQSNLVGFVNILEVCRDYDTQHLVYASSSSVYGGNTKVPFSVTDNVDHPLSLYAATKKSNELLAHAYASLFGIPMTGLRFSLCMDRGVDRICRRGCSPARSSKAEQSMCSITGICFATSPSSMILSRAPCV